MKLIREYRYKRIGQCYRADYENLRIYPRFWINSAKSIPNFDHWSFVIRWGFWYFGIQKNNN